jgi:hypothetical protein
VHPQILHTCHFLLRRLTFLHFFDIALNTLIRLLLLFLFYVLRFFKFFHSINRFVHGLQLSLEFRIFISPLKNFVKFFRNLLALLFNLSKLLFQW